MKDLELQNLQAVSLNQISPNPWNPKERIEDNEANKKQYEYLLKEMKLRGYQDPIDVREVADGDFMYQIVDGFHRYLGVKELGYTKIVVINHGIISDTEAKEITIAREKIKIPIDEPLMAQLINDIIVSIGKTAEELSKELPFSTEVINDYVEMTTFDWNDYKADIKMGDEEVEESAEVRENSEKLENLITFVLKPNEFYIIKRVIETETKKNFINRLLKAIREMDSFNSEKEKDE